DVENFDENDNLIMKGNNLLALHTLKKKYAGKVKLIYIDPPYNTGNDSFKYNDRFNRSSWLTFIKNRLEIAREILSDVVIIFVQCDVTEGRYLSGLMDDICGARLLVNDIVWKRKFGNANETRRLGTAYDNRVVYAKTSEFERSSVPEKNSEHVE